MSGYTSLLLRFAVFVSVAGRFAVTAAMWCGCVSVLAYVAMRVDV